MRKCRFCEASIEDAATVCPVCHKDLFPARAGAVVPVNPAYANALANALAPAAPAGRVTVVDIDMPFASMVGFMVKWAVAAIPAFLILAALAFAIGATIGGLGALVR